MKLLSKLWITLCVFCTLTLPVFADAIVPATPIDKMGEIGGPFLIILVLVVLPLALIVGVVYLTAWLIRKLVRKIKNRK